MAQEFNQGRADALQGLLQSLGSTEYNGQKASPEMVKQLAARLEAMLGEGQPSNAGGEALNEDGEPILEIAEPIPDEVEEPLDGKIPEDPPLVPLVDLPPEERARKKAEMEQILDELEEEEIRESAVVKEKARAQARALLEQKKRESEERANAISERRQRDKKMGKALLGALSDSSPTPPPMSAPPEPPKKKSVKFEDLPSGSIPPNIPIKKKAEWGDVMAALPSSSSRQLMRNSPMKADVIERFPAAQNLGPAPQLVPSALSLPSEADSDDESVEEGQRPIPPESNTESESEDEITDEGEVDLEAAYHQREIAVEYYARREAIMNNALSEAVQASTSTPEGDTWDKEHVPLDATLANPHPKPKGSRFKAARQQPFTSKAIEGQVLPASVLRGAVRMGKLEDGLLVGGDADSSEDEAELDVEEKQAIEKTKQELLAKSSVDYPSNPATPILDDLRSSPKLPPDEPAASKGMPADARPALAHTSQVTYGSPIPTVIPTVVNSPSFAPPAVQRRAPPRPSVMAETVQESVPQRTLATAGSSQAPQRISRFKARHS